MAHWLLKSEPSAYSWDDLVRDKRTEWTGVRNNTAALNLKAMQPGDTGYFYHSMTDKAIVGRVTITRAAQPDGEEGRWVSVEVEAGEPLARPVTLAAVKAEPRLKDMQLVRQSRLSVCPVTEAEREVIEFMARGTKS